MSSSKNLGKRQTLGRGLGELLGEVEIAYNSSTSDGNKEQANTLPASEIDINKISTNPYQPRKIFNQERLKELSENIKQYGVLQPIVVNKKDDGYVLIAGERRLRASKMANLVTIKANVLNISDSKLREIALVENIQREDLNIIEVAYSYAGLINDYKITHDELAAMVNKSRSSITNTLRLLTLSSYVQQLIGSLKISTGHGKLLVGLEENKQKDFADIIVKENLSVRQSEKLIKGEDYSNTPAANNAANENINETSSSQTNNNAQNDSLKSGNANSASSKPKPTFPSLVRLAQKLSGEGIETKASSDTLKIKFSSDKEASDWIEFFSNPRFIEFYRQAQEQKKKQN